MANEELKVTLSAVDKASTVIDDVAGKAEKLEGQDPKVTVKADDKASDPLDDIRSKLNKLDGDTAEVLLKAEKRDAQRDIAAMQREIIALDGEDATVLIQAKDEAKARLDAIRGELEKLDATVVEPKIKADDAGGAGMDAGSSFGLAAIKGIGAAGIATAIMGVFNAGMEKIKVRAQMVAQFGLVKDDAAKMSKEAAEIYAGNWGDSIGQVSTVIGTVKQQLVDVGVVSEAEMGKVAESAIVVSEAFGVDVNQVIRSTSQLLLNGLAPDAESAMDMVTVAVQGGADKAGDFWDTIDEYSQHFGAMGLSGEDMMSIISHGMQNGQRDTDKLADAIKEMRLRTTDSADAITDAYQRLGLNADEYREKILAGGDSARTAYSEILAAIDSVQDPVERNALAVELIGTMYEDLGPKALESLQAISDGFVESAGAVDALNEGLSSSASELETLGRKAKEWGLGFAETLSGSANSWLEFMGTGEDSAYQWTQQALGRDQLTGSIDRSTEAMKMGSAAAVQASIDAALKTKADEESSGAMVQASIDAALLADSTDEVAMSDEEAAAAAEELTAAVEAEAEMLRDATVALNEQVSAKRGAADATFALNDAEDGLISTLAAASEAINTADGDLRVVRQAMDDAAISAGKVADAEVRVAEETAAASGATLNATEKLDIQNESMLRSASTADGPLRDAILGYITDVNDIPESKATEIEAALRAGDISEAERLLTEVSRARQQTTTADAYTAKAEGDLNYLARERVVRVRGQYVGGGQMPGRGANGYSHTGSRFAEGETKIVVPGQVFTPDTPGVMSSVEESRRMLLREEGHDQRTMPTAQPNWPDWGAVGDIIGERAAISYSRARQRERRAS